MQTLRLCSFSLMRRRCGCLAGAALILCDLSNPVSTSMRHAASLYSSIPSSEDETIHGKGRKAAAPESEGAAAAAAASGTAETTSAPSADVDAAAKRMEVREAIIQEILSRDKVVFELKRQHELSMLRVEQNQARVLKDQEERGMYYEQNCNVHTFDTISVGLYSQRSTLYHTMSAERLRNLKVFLMVFSTLATCVYLYYRYMINPDWAYVERPMNMLGSRVMAVREQRWKHLTEAQQFDSLRGEDSEALSRP
ncbi:hypothetical protein LSCM4_00885 [Leishmania orientalis]|uniref:Transmembrane protein n=1 Tax=Leishmania orientalis TaxID=2249476 RepID=A0A836GZ42_9TRYP|nr:hypothetical protein LSCM4_00885 [Leishmania orientalis]